MNSSPDLLLLKSTPKERATSVMSDNGTIDVLVVDDLPDKLMVFETVLEQLGVNVVTARSGEEALRCVLDRNFAVILLDVNMPGMDGYETARFIRQRKKSAHTPIIFITAFAEQVQLLEGYTVGAVDYIFSPIVPEILRFKVKVFVDLFRMTEQIKRQADEQVSLAREQLARAAAEEATRRSSFLAQAGSVLGSSLDLAATQRALIRLSVPFLADLGAVTLADEHGCLGITELAWTAGGGKVIEQTLRDADALPPAIRQAIETVVETGRGTTVDKPGPAGDAKEIRGNAQDARRWPAECPLKSVSVLPLPASGRTIGTLTLALGPTNRERDWADLALAQDLAGRAAIALENARLYHNIQETDRRKNEFLVMLAHELRNPLAPIQNAVQILLRATPKTDTLLTEARAVIGRQVNHMARLIDDLLDMSRLARGSISLRKEPLDLVELMRTTCADYRPLLEQSQLQLDLRLPPDPLPVVGDPTRLVQVIGNVLHNSSKFTDAGGTVTVEVTARPKSLARIVIRDTGIGIEPELLARVFDTFTQADNSLDRRRGGLGLGLTLVKGLVELHGGQVWIKSDGLGTGTELTIQLPLATAPAAVPPAPAPAPAEDTRQRVLIVEDNQDTAETLRLLFSMAGHKVAVAHTGPAGVEIARSFRPEVVLCDIGLPGDMNGYDLAQALRKDSALAGTHLVALTGYGQEQDQERSRSAGFDAHLTKPVEFTDLERLIAELCGRT